MLVLTRKIGQQVVLPVQGITIDVVDVGKTRVRLGISAPADMPVHRREVWDRAQGGTNRPPADNDIAPDRLANDEPQRKTAPAPSVADLSQCLLQWITTRTGGRIGELSVEILDGRIVIQGSARSFYVRQLAQAAVNEVLHFCDGPSHCSVEYNIEIVQDYWRSVGDTQRLTRLHGGKR